MAENKRAGSLLSGGGGKKAGKGAQVSTAQHPVQDLDWLVTDFAERVRHVAHAVVVSADGFALAFSATLPRGHADHLAAVTSGLAGLADGAARTFQAGEVIQTAVEMEAGLLKLGSIACSIKSWDDALSVMPEPGKQD